MRTLRILVTVVALPVLVRHLDLIRHHNPLGRLMVPPTFTDLWGWRRRRRRRDHDILHLDFVHDSLLAVVEGHVPGDDVGAGAAPPIPALRAVNTAADRVEAAGGVVLVRLLGGAEHGAKVGLEPVLEEGEDHGEVGGHHGGESLADAP